MTGYAYPRVLIAHCIIGEFPLHLAVQIKLLRPPTRIEFTNEISACESVQTQAAHCHPRSNRSDKPSPNNPIRSYPMPRIIDRLRNLPQYLLPQKSITRSAYRLTRIRTPWFKNAFIRWFCRQFRVDMHEAAQPDCQAYEHFNAFFTRALKAGVRPIDPAENTAVCPVDGTVSQLGLIDDDAIFQAKGQQYSLTQLLGGDANHAKLFRNGSFATLYLSPRDYHRIHMPLAGQLREMVHIPGKLFSVSPLTTRVVPDLFARNERVVTLFDSPAGPMALILVGAINVASIETVWAGVITPPLGHSIRRWDYPDSGPDCIQLAKGAEMGRFNMGSTVIVLFGPEAVDWAPALQASSTVRLGQALAQIRPTAAGSKKDMEKHDESPR